MTTLRWLLACMVLLSPMTLRAESPLDQFLEVPTARKPLERVDEWNYEAGVSEVMGGFNVATVVLQRELESGSITSDACSCSGGGGGMNYDVKLSFCASARDLIAEFRLAPEPSGKGTDFHLRLFMAQAKSEGKVLVEESEVTPAERQAFDALLAKAKEFFGDEKKLKALAATYAELGAPSPSELYPAMARRKGTPIVGMRFPEMEKAFGAPASIDSDSSSSPTGDRRFVCHGKTYRVSFLRGNVTSFILVPSAPTGT